MEVKWKVRVSCALASVVLIGVVILSACGQQVTGPSVSIPQVNINCTAADCQLAGTYYVLAYLISSSEACTDQQISFSVARKSVEVPVACTNGSGCHGQIVASQWEAMDGTTNSTVSAGSYNVCAFLIDNSNYNGNLGGAGVITSTSLLNQNISSSSSALTLSIWP
jgi:hypothetical protein